MKVEGKLRNNNPPIITPTPLSPLVGNNQEIEMMNLVRQNNQMMEMMNKKIRQEVFNPFGNQSMGNQNDPYDGMNTQPELSGSQ
jgi:hypothetical protein